MATDYHTRIKNSWIIAMRTKKGCHLLQHRLILYIKNNHVIISFMMELAYLVKKKT